ncbi:ABC transporter permease, partial [Mesorhizobium sp. M2D.F.Ca.ET.160.01.1.1]
MSASFRPSLPVLIRREHASPAIKLAAPAAALGAATLLNLGLYLLMGRDPVAVFQAMLLE